jgi:hypothetical protein
MELLVLLVAIFGLLAISANIAYRLELSELDLFKRRLAAYEQLKSAVRRVGATGAVSNVDTDRFAHAMSGMRFLFDEDLERFVRGIYDALLKKHALDALLEKAAGQESAPTDQALIDKALRKSQELASQISNGIYGDMPEHLEKFMRRRLVSSMLILIVTLDQEEGLERDTSVLRRQGAVGQRGGIHVVEIEPGRVRPGIDGSLAARVVRRT